MKIVIAGATGFVGTPLSALLIQEGHELTILTRKIQKTASRSKRVRHIEWNPEDESSVVREVDGTDAIINLAGESVVKKRWTKHQKKIIVTSRCNATQILVRSIRDAKSKPKVLLNASAVGFYGPRSGISLDESATPGKGFLANTCKAWEAHAVRAKDFGVRVVRLRIGAVFGKSGGALEKIVPPFRMFVGGALGSGNQWVSWIHLQDVVHIIHFCLTHESISGVVNVTAPQPVTNKVFSLVLAQVLKRPCLVPVPSIALKLLVGEMADELLVVGQRAIPKKMTEAGYVFQYPEIRGALQHILTS
jgi:uncharacterized protein